MSHPTNPDPLSLLKSMVLICRAWIHRNMTIIIIIIIFLLLLLLLLAAT